MTPNEGLSIQEARDLIAQRNENCMKKVVHLLVLLQLHLSRENALRQHVLNAIYRDIQEIAVLHVGIIIKMRILVFWWW
jgi:membrane-bound ClpP family serine protease